MNSRNWGRKGGKFSFAFLPFCFFALLPFCPFALLPLNKSLLFEGIQESYAHRFTVFLGIADVCENLGESLYIVDADKFLVLFQRFLF